MTREKLEEFRQKKIAEKSKKERVEEMEVFLEKLSDFGEIYFSNDTLGKQMTREEILAMKPGRKLDALIAEKVMGWHTFSPIDTTCDYSIGVGGYRRNFAYDPTDGEQRVIPLYSRDISAAWEAVEKMRDWGGCEIGCYGTGNKRWFVVSTFQATKKSVSHQINVTAKTAQEAICKAALLAVLEEKKA